MNMNSTLIKIVSAVIVPIVGVPLYNVGYTQMNDSFGAGTYSWAVTIYAVLFVLVFALVPIGLLYSIFKGM